PPEGVDAAGRVLELVRLALDHTLDLEPRRLKIALHLLPPEQGDVNGDGLAVPLVALKLPLALVKRYQEPPARFENSVHPFECARHVLSPEVNDRVEGDDPGQRGVGRVER